jgi:hypothetical protein
MKFNSSQVTNKVIANTPFTGTVTLENITNIGITGITATVDSVVSGWNVQVNTPQNLAGSGNNTLSYTITAPNDSYITQDTFNIKLTSTEGATAVLPVNVNLERIVPRLVASTNLVSGGMLRGNQTVVEFLVTNEGGGIAQNIEVELPNEPWLKLASPATISALNPGESSTVTLLLTPDTNLPLTEYFGNFFLDTEGNDGDLSVNYNFRALSEAKGNIRINTVDELFYFAEGAPKLAGATVTLRDYFTNEVIATAVTDNTGLINLSNINEGYYNIEIKADRHDTFRQIIQLEAGETENIDAFLSRQTVQYIWTVTPTEIEDKYNISIETVFETDVQIPVVTIDPPLINLGNLQVIGQSMQVDMTVTNHGLIEANDVRLNFGSHPFYKIEPLVSTLDVLSAKSSFTLPIKITRIGDFDNPITNSSDSQIFTTTSLSVPCTIGGSLDYLINCAGGINKSTGISFDGVEGNCSGTSGGGGGGGGSSSIFSRVPIIYSTPCNHEDDEKDDDDCPYLENLQNAYESRKGSSNTTLDAQLLCIAEKVCDDPAFKDTFVEDIVKDFASNSENPWERKFQNKFGITGTIGEFLCEQIPNIDPGKIIENLTGNNPFGIDLEKIIGTQDFCALIPGFGHHFVYELLPGFILAEFCGKLNDNDHNKLFDDIIIPCFDEIYEDGDVGWLGKEIAQLIVPLTAALMRETIQLLIPQFPGLCEALGINTLNINDLFSEKSSPDIEIENIDLLPFLTQEQLYLDSLDSLNTLKIEANGQFFLSVGEEYQLKVTKTNDNGIVEDITSATTGTKYFALIGDQTVEITPDGLVSILETISPLPNLTPMLYILAVNGDDIAIGQFAVKDVDTDGDFVVDSYERSVGLDPNTSNLSLDIDGDGLADIYETFLGTLPTLKDSDGDGIDDFIEVKA